MKAPRYRLWKKGRPSGVDNLCECCRPSRRERFFRGFMWVTSDRVANIQFEAASVVEVCKAVSELSMPAARQLVARCAAGVYAHSCMSVTSRPLQVVAATVCLMDFCVMRRHLSLRGGWKSWFARHLLHQVLASVMQMRLKISRFELLLKFVLVAWRTASRELKA